MTDAPLPQSIIKTDPITGPAAWKAADFTNDTSWIHMLSAAEIAAFDAALTGLEAQGRTLDPAG